MVLCGNAVPKWITNHYTAPLVISPCLHITAVIYALFQWQPTHGTMSLSSDWFLSSRQDDTKDSATSVKKCQEQMLCCVLLGAQYDNPLVWCIWTEKCWAITQHNNQVSRTLTMWTLLNFVEHCWCCFMCLQGIVIVWWPSTVWLTDRCCMQQLPDSTIIFHPWCSLLHPLVFVLDLTACCKSNNFHTYCWSACMSKSGSCFMSGCLFIFCVCHWVNVHVIFQRPLP